MKFNYEIFSTKRVNVSEANHFVVSDETTFLATRHSLPGQSHSYRDEMLYKVGELPVISLKNYLINYVEKRLPDNLFGERPEVATTSKSDDGADGEKFPILEVSLIVLSGAALLIFMVKLVLCYFFKPHFSNRRDEPIQNYSSEAENLKSVFCAVHKRADSRCWVLLCGCWHLGARTSCLSQFWLCEYW